MSTLKVNDIVEATSGGGKIWPSRAWINFNGTGTVAIREDRNVSSLTDAGTGQYYMYFSTNMPNANYSSSGSSGLNHASHIYTKWDYTQSSSRLPVGNVIPNHSFQDGQNMNCQITT